MVSITNASAERFELDRSLVIRAQAGDSEAFTAIFIAYKTRIYSVCLRMTSSAWEAEDLTQEAFLHAFRKLYTFRRDCALSTWLYRIAVNTVLMHFRKNGGGRFWHNQSSGPDPYADCETKDARLFSSLDRIALTRAIGELPRGYRQIFLLHEVAGYQHEEIAALLHCSMGNSKSQLHKAKLRMRKLMHYESIEPAASKKIPPGRASLA